MVVDIRVQHKIRTYSTVKVVDGKRAVLQTFSCGPCKLYGKMYKTPAGREYAITRHLEGYNV